MGLEIIFLSLSTCTMNFEFETQYEIERTGSALTPLSGLIAFASFVNCVGVLDKLESNFPVERTSNNALSIRDVRVGFMLTVLLDGSIYSK